MASEIRANTLKNRVGLGTVSFTNTGPVVSGIVTANTIRLADDNKIQLGDEQDLEILHDPSNGIIRSINSGGNMHVESKNHIELNVNYNPSSGSKENALKAIANNGVSLYFNGLQKFQTTNTGATVTGTLVATTFDGNVTGNISGGTVAGSTGIFSGDVSITDKIVHTDDTNTAIRFPADDQVSIETAGSQRFRIDSSGNVGIDETGTILGKLHVVGGRASGTAYNAAVFAGGQNSTSGSGVKLYLSGCENDPTSRGVILESIMTDNANAHRFSILVGSSSAAPTERFRINSSGQVKFLGNQSTAPGGELGVRFDKNGTTTLNIENLSNSSVNNQARIALRTNNGYAYFSYYNQGELYVSNPEANGYFVYYGNTGNGASQRLRINSNGRISISGNTTNNAPNSPDGNLHIQDSSAGTVTADADANELILESSGNTGMSILSPGSGESSIYFGNPGTNGQKDAWIKYYHETHSTTANRRALTFRTSGGEKLRIDSNGDVLINRETSIDVASTATAKLQVKHDAGNISAAFYSTANALGPSGVLALGHARNSDSGVLQDNDVLGQIRFAGGDGNDLETQGALISAEVNGTPSSNVMPADLVFSTNAGSGSVTERLRLFKNGKLQLKNTLTSSVQSHFEIGDTQGYFNFQMSDSSGGSDFINHVKKRFVGKNTYGLTITSRSTLSGSYTKAGEASIKFYYPSAGGGAQAGGQLEFWTNQNGYAGTSEAKRMQISNSGNIGAPNGNNIYNASDERLKENMVELTNGLDKIKKLKPISFNWKDGWDECMSGKKEYGFGAQTTQVVDEMLVEPFGTEDTLLNGEVITNPLRVNEKYIVPLLVKAIQEQQEQIETLKTEVDALKSS